MYAFSRAKNLINEYDARIAVDFIYNRRKNNRDFVITQSSNVIQLLTIFIMQASKKRDRFVKIAIIIFIVTPKQASQASVTRRSERLMLIQ